MIITRRKLFADTVLDNLLDAQKKYGICRKGRRQRSDSAEPIYFTSSEEDG